MHRIVLIALLALPGCTKSLNMDAVKGAISAGVKDQLGLTAEKVTCPEKRDGKAGDAFDCTVAAQGGGQLTIKVTQKDGDGNVEWAMTDLKGLIAVGKVEQLIKDGLKEQAKINAASVTCGGGKLRAAVAGKTFDCKVKLGDAERVATVTMNDNEGAIGWKLVEAPKPAEPPAAAEKDE